jgi:hypothetical protein
MEFKDITVMYWNQEEINLYYMPLNNLYQYNA